VVLSFTMMVDTLLAGDNDIVDERSLSNFGLIGFGLDIAAEELLERWVGDDEETFAADWYGSEPIKSEGCSRWSAFPNRFSTLRPDLCSTAVAESIFNMAGVPSDIRLPVDWPLPCLSSGVASNFLWHEQLFSK
jgi:hypothetical protein